MDDSKKKKLFVSYLLILTVFLYVSDFDENHLGALIIWCVLSIYTQFCYVFNKTIYMPQGSLKPGERMMDDLRFAMLLTVTVVQIVLAVVMSNKSGLLS